MQRNGGVEGPRRLATILAADIAGYSRLLGEDEEGTLARVKRYRRELIDPTVADHNGRIVKWMGDGFLAEFGSPVEAVRCAVVIQQSMAGRNAALARSHWILFRVGVNLGDIIIDSDDIYGEGVNLAVRLQDLADPGGVYISGGVYELVKNKLVVGYQPLGDQKVKNITDPVRVYRVLPDPDAVAKARKMRARAAAAIVVAGGLALAAYWWQAGSAKDEPKPEPIAAAGVPAPAGTGPSSGAAEPAAPAAPPPAATGHPPEDEQRRLAAVAPPAPPPPPSRIREPEMVALPGGSFTMGSNEDASERPIHQVTIRPFLIGKFPVTVGEWKQCVAAGACADLAGGEDAAPIANVSWNDAQSFVSWLRRETKKGYRLPTEAEWEYAARGGTRTRYWWGNEVALGMADCRGCGGPYNARAPLKTGSFPPNPFGLYDMTGGVAQWVADCWHRDYRGAPADGASWDAADCREHVLRGGSWQNDPSYMRAASRDQYDTGVRYITHGFRV